MKVSPQFPGLVVNVENLGNLKYNEEDKIVYIAKVILAMESQKSSSRLPSNTLHHYCPI